MNAIIRNTGGGFDICKCMFNVSIYSCACRRSVNFYEKMFSVFDVYHSRCYIGYMMVGISSPPSIKSVSDNLHSVGNVQCGTEISQVSKKLATLFDMVSILVVPISQCTLLF